MKFFYILNEMNNKNKMIEIIFPMKFPAFFSSILLLISAIIFFPFIFNSFAGYAVSGCYSLLRLLPLCSLAVQGGKRHNLLLLGRHSAKRLLSWILELKIKDKRLAKEAEKNEGDSVIVQLGRSCWMRRREWKMPGMEERQSTPCV